MPEELNPNKGKKIAVSLALVLAAVLVGWWFLSRNSAAPPGGQSPAPTAPTPVTNRIVGGEVLSVVLSDKKIVIGAYRVENNKAVLASQSTVYYTDATVFSREVKSPSGSAAEKRISPEDIKIGEVAMIVASGASPADRLVAERVTLVLPPPPPRK